MKTESDTSVGGGASAMRTAANEEERRLLAEYLARDDVSQVVEFLPKDDDELDDALCAGRFKRVVFANLDALLSMIWKGHARVDQWEAAGVSIELADPHAGNDPGWRLFVGRMYGSLAGWRWHQRRRQIIAAVILSLLALAAMAVLLLLVPVAS